MAEVLALEKKYKHVGIAIVLIGIVLFSVNHIVHLAAFRELQFLYPECENSKTAWLNRSEENLLIRNDCWSGVVTTRNNDGLTFTPNIEDAEYAMECLGYEKVIIYYPMDQGNDLTKGRCSLPVRFKSINEQTLILKVKDYGIK